MSDVESMTPFPDCMLMSPDMLGGLELQFLFDASRSKCRPTSLPSLLTPGRPEGRAVSSGGSAVCPVLDFILRRSGEC